MKFRQTRQYSGLISLTPLIDIIFILLIFFMLVTNFDRWHQIEIEQFEDHQVSKKTPELSPVIINIHENGSTYIDQSKFNEADLLERLKNLLKINPKQSIIIKPHKQLSVQTLVDLLDRLNKSKLENFTLLSITP